MSRWLARLLGGRPMRRVAPAFVDPVTGDRVSVFRDYFGRWWLAVGPWDAFRVACRRPRAWLRGVATGEEPQPRG